MTQTQNSTVQPYLDMYLNLSNYHGNATLFLFGNFSSLLLTATPVSPLNELSLFSNDDPFISHEKYYTHPFCTVKNVYKLKWYKYSNILPMIKKKTYNRKYSFKNQFVKSLGINIPCNQNNFHVRLLYPFTDLIWLGLSDRLAKKFDHHNLITWTTYTLW